MQERQGCQSPAGLGPHCVGCCGGWHFTTCVQNVTLGAGLSRVHSAVLQEEWDSSIATELRGQWGGAMVWPSAADPWEASRGKCCGAAGGLEPKSIWGKLGVTSAQRWLLTLLSSECKGVAFSRIGSAVSGF